MQALDYSVALLTLALTFFVGCMMANWTYRLWYSGLILFPLTPSIVIFKFSIAAWAAGSLYDMAFMHSTPALATLPARLAVLIAAAMQAFVVIRMRRPEEQMKRRKTDV